MKVVIITSKDSEVVASPLVVVEDDKGIIKYYSKNKEQDKLDNEMFLYAKKNNPKKSDLKSMLHGYSYLHMEFLEYGDSNRERIDGLLVSLGHEKLDPK